MISASKPYHHGALRDALVAAAVAELAENGIARFTLRGTARRAGVSHAAPAHHFGNVQGLMEAVATEAFERMADAISSAMAEERPGTIQYVRAAARGYVRFALANPDMFRLMFRLQETTKAEAGVQDAGRSAFGLAAQAVGSFHGVDDAMADPATALRVIGLWALAHGLAELAIGKQFDPMDEQRVADQIIEQWVRA
jgi:AcrR family transcriptional regulator